MNNQESIVVGLDVGTAKVCALVSEAGPDGLVNIIGEGTVPSRGVRKGEVIDTTKAEEDIRAAVAEAEKSADIEIRNLILGVTGTHIHGFNNRGIHNITSDDGEITEDDMDDVVRQARNISLPVGKEIIHTVRQHYHVDQQEGIINPLGLLGNRLEVDVHVIHGLVNRLQNPIRTVRGLQLDVEAIAFNGRASALAVLSREQCERGALLIDLGAGVTEYVAFMQGTPKHSAVLGVGGDHVTNDISVGLKVTTNRAEQIKKDHGRALSDPSINGKTLDFTSEIGLSDQSVKLAHLHLVMHARLEEIFLLIKKDLKKVDILEHLHGGVYLTGGGARVKGVSELAEQVLGVPANTTRNQSESGLQEVLDQPEYSSAIGLVKHGVRHLGSTRKPGMMRRMKHSLLGLFGSR